MKIDSFDEDPTRPREWLLPVLGVLVATLMGYMWLAELPRSDNLVRAPTVRDFRAVRTAAIDPQPTGTAGSDLPAARDAGTSPTADRTSAHELEAIIGSRDVDQLIGRRVTLQLPAVQVGNQITFWVGSSDNPLLAVAGRDVRTPIEKQQGVPSDNGIVDVQRNQMATIAGTIQRLPTREERFSWGLTKPERERAEARKIYLRVDTVMPGG